jgi:hypothetical protein
MELTTSEKEILLVLRSLKPFERVEVVASNDGKPDKYFITRKTKVILVGGAITFVE